MGPLPRPPLRFRTPTPADDDALARLLGRVFGPHPDQGEMLGRWLADPGLRPLFEGAGFTLLGTSADFYARVQARTGQPCRWCGTPCTCRARLYGATAVALRAALARGARPGLDRA